jgi:2-oxo-3-hexenedioate decarboxylase
LFQERFLRIVSPSDLWPGTVEEEPLEVGRFRDGIKGYAVRTVWVEYGPIWGYVYNRTVHNLAQIGDTFSLSGLAEPRIEPEIVFKLASALASGMDETALLACIEWVGHGFEIVQSIFPGWKFSAPDAVAAFGLHGALLIGPCHSVAACAEDWSRTLPTFEIDLKRDDTIADHGRGTNVLDGPVSALHHLVDILVRDQVNPPLAAGEIVTTGTLTRALPVAPGETWTTELTGVALDGICVRFPWVTEKSVCTAFELTEK